MTVLLIAAMIAGLVCADIRWLRVAQREHYLAGSVLRFSQRWWTSRPVNAVLYALPLTALFGIKFAPITLLAPLAVIVGPIGLTLRGRTSKLAWTRRLRVVAVVTGLIQILVFVAVAVVNVPAAVVISIVTAEATIDLALFVTAPVEKRLSQKFVDQAQKRLQQVAPTVIAITGSYGKTSTKTYLAHLVTGTRHVLATPASFNNRAGLSRAINEQLSPGTDVFIAEMGTYGPGEIRELCNFVSPEIAIITAIGPVHLERFKTEDAIIEAKSEIFEKASVCILNIDDERLERLAEQLRTREGKRVVTCGSKNANVDVRVEQDEHGCVVTIADDVAQVPVTNAPLTNLACAIAAAREVGVSLRDISLRIPTLPVPQHRQEVSKAESGVIVIDDTYNANPASTRRGLQLLATAASGKRVVATPGMVELGPQQDAANQEFASEAAKAATDLVIIGRTNRKALMNGAKNTDLHVVVVDRLPQAVEWMRQHVGEGDAVLYANDLPDHYS